MSVCSSVFLNSRTQKHDHLKMMLQVSSKRFSIELMCDNISDIDDIFAYLCFIVVFI